MAELDKTSSVDSTPVEIDMLDFAYVEHCDDWKKLFSILEVLRSGKEGHFPELCKVTEDKMLQIMPDKEKRKYVALHSVASADEIAQVSLEMQIWQQATSSTDAQLKSRDFNSVRVFNKALSNNLFAIISKNQREKIFDAGKKLKIEELFTFQKDRKAEMERRKGNESFKATEYEASVRCYTNSIALNPFNDSVWANRAIAYIKLNLFDLAEQDCDACLHLQPNNVKAYARRGFACFSQGKYKSAATDYLAAMRLDPANEEYPKFLEKSKEMYKSVEGKQLIISNALSTTDTKKLSAKDTTNSTSNTASAPLRVVSVSTSANWITIDCEMVSSLAALLVPTETVSELKEGKLAISTLEAHDSDVHVLDKGTYDEGEETYVTIPVSIADDDEETIEQNEENTNFVRINISEEDSEGEDEVMNIKSLSELELEAGLNSEMTSTDKAVALKNFGNNLMLRSDWSTSIAAYTRSLQYQYMTATLNNRCQARLSSGEFSGAIVDADAVLKEEPQNVKALYRRAKACYELQLLDACQEDLKRLLQLEPQNAPALTMQQTVQSARQKLEAERCKIEGNNAFQQGDVTQAVQLYNRALDLDPLNISIYSNRALAHLAIGHLPLAITDCNTVIDQCEEDNSLLKKAYQRRAEARWRLATTEESLSMDQKLSFLYLALQDSTQAEELSVTADKNVTALLQNIRQTIDSVREQQQQQQKQEFRPGSSPSTLTNLPITTTQQTPATTSSKSNPNTTEKTAKIPGSEQKLKLELPSAPAKTLYEFERIWRGFASRNDLRLEYLRLFKSSHFKKVFKAAISDDLLSSLFSSLLALTVSKVNNRDMSLCVKVLESLQQMNSFALTIRMLPQETLHQLRDLFSHLLQVAAVEDKIKISELQSAYNI